MIIVDKQKHVEKKSKLVEAISSIEPTVQAVQLGVKGGLSLNKNPAIY